MTSSITSHILTTRDQYETIATIYHTTIEDVWQVARDITTLIEDTTMSVEEFKLRCASIDQFYS